MTKASCTISILGLGEMGRRVARRLLEEFGDLTVWNRTPGRAEELAAAGAVVAATPRSAAAEATLTVLTDLEAVESVLRGSDGLLAGWKEKGILRPILVIHGTVSPVGVAMLAEELANDGIAVLDAPLSGGTFGAEEGTLSVMIGGDKNASELLSPVFDVIGKTVRYLGRSGSGQLAKACNQIVVAATVTALSEAVLLARQVGLDIATLFELLSGGLASSEVLRQKATKWLNNDFLPGGSAKNQLKDLRFVIESANANKLRLPLAETVTDLFAQVVSAGDGDLDHTGVYRTLERLAVKGSR